MDGNSLRMISILRQNYDPDEWKLVESDAVDLVESDWSFEEIMEFCDKRLRRLKDGCENESWNNSPKS